MGNGFKKFVESSTDARYAKFGTKCAICQKRLGFFETGFWSINANWVADGTLCKSCADKAHDYILNKRSWMKAAQYKSEPFKSFGARNWKEMDVDTVKLLFEMKSDREKEILNKHQKQDGAVFRVSSSQRIEASALDVGVARAKKLNNKIAIFGTVDTGTISKGDSITIESCTGENTKTATVLEAYVYDCEENTLEINLKAHMGRQRIGENKSGWLVLDTEQFINSNDTVIK